ncbi:MULTISPECIES: hypothetical protein [unclassified Lysinibacillus]|uniref:hypothetical protein n=1 Tax=unclassified Lysinibacillus TaxID=2636778 RepID=UPI000887B739|nr:MULTISPECIES: hypothetical protein [unclassified Lysinibacillus]SCY87137.1 hypothetical protein SAMN02787078_02807 [Lysinibacillus sp. SG9]SDB38313.1 hypothetical protein SAMN02787079_02847 [Lysinibacillus sp. TC-37]SFT02323.1 hypothetical protein SAMN02787087_03102 [Lysinibacillus sp. SG55]
MFLFSSAIAIEVIYYDFQSILRNHSFFEKNGNKSNTNSFFSLHYHDETKKTGEIHYTKSFEYGALNVIPFVRTENTFFILTSSVQHIKFFKKVINDIVDDKIIFKKLLINYEKIHLLEKIDGFQIMKTDSSFELSGIINFENKRYYLKFYSNGVITFPLTNNMDLLYEVISVFLNLRILGE